MDVRLARPTDALLVLSLSLDEGAHLVHSSGWPSCNPVLRSVARTAVQFAPRERLWVAHDRHESGLLEASPRRYVMGWDITRLVIHGDHLALTRPLVNAAVEHLQSRQVPRLFARCSEDGAEELKLAGFHALAREYVLLGQSVTPKEIDTLPIDSRYRMPQDAWPLHQLESDVTPTLVRQMEGLASMDWSRRRPTMKEVVVERDGRVAAWVGWGVRLGRGVSQLGLLIHPNYAEFGPSLLQHALAATPPGVRLVARVRDYQPETLNALQTAGFSMVGEEILMVKHAQLVPVQALKPIIAVAGVPSVQVFRRHLRVVAGNPRRPLCVPNGYREEES